MALEFEVVRVDFPPTKGTEQRASVRASFSGPVRRAAVALQGFQMAFVGGDHSLGMQRLLVSPHHVSGNVVSFTAFLLLRDSSGAIDDRYSGFAEYLVAADVVERT